MESFGDKLRAFALAFGLHLACVLVLLAGLWWTHSTKPVVMPGPVIEATLVGPTEAPKPASKRAATRAPKPQPRKPEPPKPAAEPPRPPPTEVVRQDREEQERIAALAQQKAERERKEQEERIRQEQVELEQEQRRREEQRKQLEEIRRQRAEAERKVQLERERLAQLEDRNRRDAEQASQAEAAREGPKARTGAGGTDDDLTARYAAAIQAAVTDNWNRPEHVAPGLRCRLRIAQIPGGEVISVTVGTPCNADPVTRNSIEQAVLKAAPLPYQGYEKVFQRNINFNFRYDG